MTQPIVRIAWSIVFFVAVTSVTAQIFLPYPLPGKVVFPPSDFPKHPIINFPFDSYEGRVPCGVQPPNPNPLPKIPDDEVGVIGGRNAYPGEFPWLVNFQWRELLPDDTPDPSFNNPWRSFCAGTLINYRMILTAAHCIHLFQTHVEEYRFNFGCHDLKDEANCFSIIVRFNEIQAHAIYHQGEVHGLPPLPNMNDIGIIFLTSPKAVNNQKWKGPLPIPICLEMEDKQKEWNPFGHYDGMGSVLSTAGFGKTIKQDRRGRPYREDIYNNTIRYDVGETNRLKKIDIKILTYSDCAQERPSDPLTPKEIEYINRKYYWTCGHVQSCQFNGTLENSCNLCGAFCGGWKRKQVSSCHGDSGAPVVTQTPEGKFVLIGITSDGLNGCGKPGHYVRVFAYLRWIRETFLAFYRLVG